MGEEQRSPGEFLILLELIINKNVASHYLENKQTKMVTICCLMSKLMLIVISIYQQTHKTSYGNGSSHTWETTTLRKIISSATVCTATGSGITFHAPGITIKDRNCGGRSGRSHSKVGGVVAKVGGVTLFVSKQVSINFPHIKGTGQRTTFYHVTN